MTTLHAAPLAREPGLTLGEITRLFRALEAEEVRYCHWKSNQHLRASMEGKTDLDVLVDRRAVQALALALARTSFRRLATPPRRGYPGVESYVGMDAETGALIHLHLHYQLTVGERHLKGYRLPWEELVLSTRIWDEAEGIYVADPNLEFLLLAVRSALKLRVRDRLAGATGRPYVRGNLRREWRWLVARIDPVRLGELAGQLLGPEAARLLLRMAAGAQPGAAEFVRFRRAATPPLNRCRTYGALAARCRRWGRELSHSAANLAAGWGALIPRRRLLPYHGVVVAFVGADGSGKSTLVRSIGEWLTPMVDVVPIYFGSGQGPASVARRLLEGVARVVRRTAPKRAQPAAPRRRGTGSPVRVFGELLWVFALARERRRRTRKAQRARDRGMVVLCDRFPLSRSQGNDGPYLAHLNRSRPWIRWVARRELEAIREVERLGPDLLIRLNVSLETALSRKPDTPPDALATKLRVLRELEVPPGTRVVDIDASQPLGRVLLEAKRAIWSGL